MLIVRSSGSWLVLLAVASGCTRDNPAYDGGSGEGSGKGTLDGFDTASTASPETTGPGSGGGTSNTTTSGSNTLPLEGTSDTATTTAGETASMDCPLPPLEGVAYEDCEACEGECIEVESGPPVVFNLLVCASACEESCQCPTPDTGSAIPTCAPEGCVLDCSADRECPSGMLCHAESQLCMWSNAYGPCGPSCPTNVCLWYEMLGNVCPAVSCLDGEAPGAQLCPPPPGGDATPVCFEPGNFPGEGWCVPSCARGETCPPGTMCSGGPLGTCIHPL